MLDHQTARRVRKGAHAACALIALALAAPAGAQLEIIPATPPAGPGADTPALGGDAAHRNAWVGTGLRPPLELAWQTTGSPVFSAISVGPRVIIQTDSRLKAVRTSDGGEIWSVPRPSPVEVATEGARVYVTSSSGVAALDIDTGAIVWANTEPGASGPVVADGRLLIGNQAGEIVALQASNGTRLWRTEVGIAGARPAVAGLRAYASGVCRGASVEVALGITQWTSGCAQDAGTRTLLASTAVYSEDGPIFAAQDGAIGLPAAGPGTIGSGLLFRNPIANPATALQARGPDFGVRWTYTPPLPGSKLLLRPASVDGFVYQVVDAGGEGLVLAALDAATGAERWSGFLPGTGSFAPAVGSAVAAAPGLLLVPTAQGGLAALRNAAEGPLSVRATLPRNVVGVGDETTVTGRLVSDGKGLVGPRLVILQSDPHPFDGKYKTVAGAVAGRAGFSFAAKITRNTNLRLAADNIVYPPTPVYVQPEIGVKYKETAVDLVVRATLRIKREPGFKRAGVVALYRLKEGAIITERIGVGRARRNGVARFKVRIPPDLTETDRVLPCLRGGSKRGFGPPNVLDRLCGDKTIQIPAQSSSSTGALGLETLDGVPLPPR